MAQRELGRWHVTTSLVLVLVAWQWTSGIALAIKIENPRWGFNGKVAPNRFNMLSVMIDNPTPELVEGTLTLRKTMGGGYVDAKYIEAYSLAPFTSKWIQFYPYIGSGWGNSSSNEEWKLFPDRGETVEIPIPHIAKYQRVFLEDSSNPAGRGGSSVLRGMPENLFPAFVSATDALQAVGLDREPRTWIPAQKEAFLDWIYLGGTVVLMPGSSGKLPEFSGPLAVLNSPLDDIRYGAGRLVKTSLPRNQFNEEIARQMFADLPKNHVNNYDRIEDPIDYVDPGQRSDSTSMGNYGDGSDSIMSSAFLPELKEMTKPDHNWGLLHLLFWVYIGMIFPGCFILSRRWSDFRVVYAGLLGTVFLFSILFSIVGQRGYGESTAVHSVAIARTLRDGGMDVASWSNVFVTTGADYSIKHNARGVLYSTCNEVENVNGKIDSGVDAEFVVDIPPFSNREFAARMRLPGGSPILKIDQIELSEGRLNDLQLHAEGIDPKDTMRQYVLSGDRFYTLRWNDGRLCLDSEVVSAPDLLKLEETHNRSYRYRSYDENNHQTVISRFGEMFNPLLSRSLNVAREKEARQVKLPPDMLRVLIYSKMPATFAVQNQRLGAQNGYVLYSINLTGFDTEGRPSP